MASETAQDTVTYHGGRLVARRLKAHGVSKLFTLSGGHLFSIYDGCREEGIAIVDVRHESDRGVRRRGLGQGHARARRVRADGRPRGHQRDERDGLRAGQPLADRGARRTRSGRCAGARDRCRRSTTSRSCSRSRSSPPRPTPRTRSQRLLDDAFTAALTPPLRPRVRGLPARSRVHGGAERARAARRAGPSRARRRPPRRPRSRAPGELLRRRRAAGDHGRHRPVLGSRRAGAARAGRAAADPRVPERAGARLPARPTTSCSSLVPAPQGLKEADVALVIGVPMDFRLGLRGRLRRGHRDRRGRRRRAGAPPPARGGRGVLRGARPDALRRSRTGGRRAAAATRLDLESARRPRPRSAPPSTPSCTTTRAPLHPMRVYAELAEVIDRDAIVIGDGGDFVSYAGRGSWTATSRAAGSIPGPFGCLGSGPGLRAGGEARPPRPRGRAAARRRCVRLRRDGVRHARAPRRRRRRRDREQRHLGAREAPDGVPLRLLGRGRPAARARATTRSSRRSAATASWCERPEQLRGALERALASERPALVNVLTDPAVAYPRRSNLA